MIYAEDAIAAVLAAAVLTDDPGISFLRSPDGIEQLPQLVISLTDAEHYDLVDDRYIGEDSATYRLQIWTDKRRDLLAIYREILAWFKVWRPLDLVDRLLSEVTNEPVPGGADLADLVTAIDTAQTAMLVARAAADGQNQAGKIPTTGLAAELTALTHLHTAWPAGLAAPKPGENVAAALTALEGLRAVLPEIRFGVVPVRSMDTPHAGFQDRGVYERNIALLYIPDGA